MYDHNIRNSKELQQEYVGNYLLKESLIESTIRCNALFDQR